MTWALLFPNAGAGNIAPHSDPTFEYNCIAFAIGYDKSYIWPDPAGVYPWHPDLPREETLENFAKFFELIGYHTSGIPNNDSVQFEYIALYGDTDGITHAARQLADGRWVSKLSGGLDIRHTTPGVIECEQYGAVVAYMRRPRTPNPPPLPDLQPEPSRLIRPNGMPI